MCRIRHLCELVRVWIITRSTTMNKPDIHWIRHRIRDNSSNRRWSTRIYSDDNIIVDFFTCSDVLFVKHLLSFDMSHVDCLKRMLFRHDIYQHLAICTAFDRSIDRSINVDDKVFSNEYCALNDHSCFYARLIFTSILCRILIDNKTNCRRLRFRNVFMTNDRDWIEYLIINDRFSSSFFLSCQILTLFIVLFWRNNRN
jgi:hypothetical protein